MKKSSLAFLIAVIWFFNCIFDGEIRSEDTLAIVLFLCTAHICAAIEGQANERKKS